MLVIEDRFDIVASIEQKKIAKQQNDCLAVLMVVKSHC